jgi:predicted ATPase
MWSGLTKQKQVVVTGQCEGEWLELRTEIDIFYTTEFSQGRANVGKSTLLNAVAGRTNLFYAGKKPVSLVSANIFATD